jgi:DNA-directed RNA polymerase subunit alpha
MREQSPATDRQQAARPEPHPWADRSIAELELDARTMNALANAGLQTIGDLCRRTDVELLKTRGVNRRTLIEIKTVLADLGLSLGRFDL